MEQPFVRRFRPLADLRFLLRRINGRVQLDRIVWPNRSFLPGMRSCPSRPERRAFSRMLRVRGASRCEWGAVGAEKLSLRIVFGVNIGDLLRG